MRIGKHIHLMLLSVVMSFLTAVGTLGCGSSNPGTAEAEQAQREKEFQEMMTGATMEGHFTSDSRDPTTPRPETYHIQSVSKLAGDYWTFQARIQYGEHDVTLPIPVRIEWAGDTPVITLTDAEIPGLGTFTARVLLYRGRYAGTWSHGEHGGGNQFGRIVPRGAATE
jgi:hypothetical protein